MSQLDDLKIKELMIRYVDVMPLHTLISNLEEAIAAYKSDPFLDSTEKGIGVACHMLITKFLLKGSNVAALIADLSSTQNVLDAVKKAGGN